MTFEPTNPIDGEDDDQPVPHQQQREADPGIVREIAKAAVGYALRLCRDSAVGAALLASTSVPVLGREFDALGRDAIAEYDRMAAALSWPDEQQPAEATGGEQVQDGAVGRVEVWADAWDANVGDEHIITAWLTRAGRLPDDDCPELTMPDLRVVLAERKALATRVAELEAELDMCTCGESKKVCGLRTELDQAQARLNEATARAESATVLPERWRALIAERDAAVKRAEEAHSGVDRWLCYANELENKLGDERQRAEKAEARLAELGEPETEQRVIGASGAAYTPTLLDLEHRADWRPGARLEERQVYPTPWRVVPDAAQNGRSAMLRAEDGVQASGSELEFGSGSVGLSEPELFADACDCECQPGQPCLCPERDCYCGPCRVCGDNPQQPADTTEDDRG